MSHTRVRDDPVHWYWSPEQIAGRLRAVHPDDPERRSSHETTHAAIYAQPHGVPAGAALVRWSGKSGRLVPGPVGQAGHLRVGLGGAISNWS